MIPETYLDFIRDFAGIPVAALPDASPYIEWSYAQAGDYVIDQLKAISERQYDWARYNLGVDFLINWCPDQSGQDYFAKAREGYKITAFVSGVVTGGYDEGTGTTIQAIDATKNMTLGDLQNLKTPFGRAYLALMQPFGSLWGVT